MLKKSFRLSLFILFITSSLYAQEVISGFDKEKDLTILNNELSNLDVDNQIKNDGRLDLHSNKIENLATPTATADGATKGYVDTMGQAAGGDLTGTYPNPTIADGKVDQGALKTTTGEVSRSTAGYLELSGGSYAFFPQTKMDTGACVVTFNGSHSGATFPGTTYGNWIYCYDFASGGTYYAQTRYVTASGTDWFVFLLADKKTGEIVQLYSSADHPSYGQGGDYGKTPHPFKYVDFSNYEIVILDKDTVKRLQDESSDIDEDTGVKRLATLINRNYKVDMTKTLPYIPLHSGKFKKKIENGKEIVIKQMVKDIPNYIKVRTLIRK